MPVVPLDLERLKHGLAELARIDPDIARGLEEVGLPQPRIRPEGFATLLQIITAQQVSVASAGAIWRRLEAGLGAVSPDAIAALTVEDLRRFGFSRPKAAYALGLADAVRSGVLDLDRLAEIEDAEVVRALTALKGFGRWSAEIYLVFALGRTDVFPADDLAVRVGLARLKRLDPALSARDARAVAEAWSPWRSSAALLMWHYYGAATLDRT